MHLNKIYKSFADTDFKNRSKDVDKRVGYLIHSKLVVTAMVMFCLSFELEEDSDIMDDLQELPVRQPKACIKVVKVGHQR